MASLGHESISFLSERMDQDLSLVCKTQKLPAPRAVTEYITAMALWKSVYRERPWKTRRIHHFAFGSSAETLLTNISIAQLG